MKMYNFIICLDKFAKLMCSLTRNMRKSSFEDRFDFFISEPTHLFHQSKQYISIHDFRFLYEFFYLLDLVNNERFTFFKTYNHLFGYIIQNHSHQIYRALIEIQTFEVKIIHQKAIFLF